MVKTKTGLVRERDRPQYQNVRLFSEADIYLYGVIGGDLAHDVHLFDQVACIVDFLHDPEHVARVDMNGARRARIEIPIRVDAFNGAVEQQSDQLAIRVQRC